MSTRAQDPGCTALSSLRGATLQNRGSKADAMKECFRIDSGSILAAQMGPKSRPKWSPDTLSNVYQSQIKKTRFF